MLNQSLTRQIKIENPSKIPVKVNLVDTDPDKTQFTLSATEFIIKQYDEFVVDITFCSAEQNKFEYNFNIEYTDVEDCGTKKDKIPVSIKAEAFHVVWNLQYPDDKG